jgi:hypothetical protein
MVDWRLDVSHWGLRGQSPAGAGPPGHGFLGLCCGANLGGHRQLRILPFPGASRVGNWQILGTMRGGEARGTEGIIFNMNKYSII